MTEFLNWMMYVIRKVVIAMLIWGGLLLVLFIIIGLLIGVAQVILGGTASILIKYTAIIIIFAVIYGTFDAITTGTPEEELDAFVPSDDEYENKE